MFSFLGDVHAFGKSSMLCEISFFAISLPNYNHLFHRIKITHADLVKIDTGC
jgi:hypothetical protein